jgi:hypothetical protein
MLATCWALGSDSGLLQLGLGAEPTAHAFTGLRALDGLSSWWLCGVREALLFRVSALSRQASCGVVTLLSGALCEHALTMAL